MHKHEVYLASEEVSSFLNSSENKLLGFSYEWEGENVIHLHSHPLLHSFGRVKRCLFTKEPNIPASIFDEQIRYIVSISKSDNHPVIKVYTLENNSVIEICAKLIPGKDEL